MSYLTRLALSAAVVIPLALACASCGGAIDNSDPAKKSRDSASGASGGPAATSDPPPSPSSTPFPEPPPPLKPPAPCAVSFKKDVLLTVFANNGCATASCHGGVKPAADPRIDLSDAPATYKALVNYTMSDGQRYVATQVRKSSGMSCNLRGACGVGMPIGGNLTPEELSVVDEWLGCGAPQN